MDRGPGFVLSRCAPLTRICRLKRDLLAIEDLRELLTTAFEINLSLVWVDENQDLKHSAEFSVEHNRDTRRLASWAAIVTVPTLIAGIYGVSWRCR